MALVTPWRPISQGRKPTAAGRTTRGHRPSTAGPGTGSAVEGCWVDHSPPWVGGAASAAPPRSPGSGQAACRRPASGTRSPELERAGEVARRWARWSRRRAGAGAAAQVALGEWWRGRGAGTPAFRTSPLRSELSAAAGKAGGWAERRGSSLCGTQATNANRKATAKLICRAPPRRHFGTHEHTCTRTGRARGLC